MSKIKPQGTKVAIPHLAESLVSATIGKWLVKPGDIVQEYDTLCELITDKVNADMPSPVAGTVLELLAEEGETLSVGEPICLIAEAGGPEGRDGGDAPGAATEESEAAPATEEHVRQRYSPAVRKLAAEHGVDLRRIAGTGLGGRITRKDVLQAIAQKGAAQEAEAGPSGAAAFVAAESGTKPEKLPVRTTGLHLSESPRIPQIAVDEGDGDRREYFIDVTPIRNTIATRMRQSVAEIPHAWTVIEADVTNLVMLRNKLKEDFKRKEGVNLTYLAFMIKAVVNAIKDYPIINSVWAVDKIIVKRDINISLAVGTEDSVLTPVIKKADQKNIAGLAREIDELSHKARSGTLRLDELQGGTITVNNTGSFGSILSYPIINYPQAVNLTFESIVKRPVVIQDMIAVRSMVYICLSLDHRILDGVICGRFLQRLKENLESYGPDTKLY
ncbi:MAG TPA: dihydrolipoamide acetyltransferase family protein [Bacilli bacterium]